jgi:hypothetical protein
MKVLEATIGNAKLKTVFLFEGSCDQWAEEVLECLRGKTIEVPDPARRWSPPWTSGEVDLDECEIVFNRLREWAAPADWETREIDWGVIEISLVESLPAVCRCVMLGNPETDNGVRLHGSYRIQVNPIRYAFDVGTKPGPGTFAGEIILSSAFADNEDAFCYMLAHELQHAVNHLPSVYPALVDWEGYKDNVLQVNRVPIDDFAFAQVEDEVLNGNIEGSKQVEILEGMFGPRIHSWFRGYERFCGEDDSS